MHIRKMMTKLRSPSDNKLGKLVMVMTDKVSSRGSAGLEIWKEYRMVDPV